MLEIFCRCSRCIYFLHLVKKIKSYGPNNEWLKELDKFSENVRLGCLYFELGIPSSIKNVGYYELVPKSGFTPQVWKTPVASVWRQVLAKRQVHDEPMWCHICQLFVPWSFRLIYFNVLCSSYSIPWSCSSFMIPVSSYSFKFNSCSGGSGCAF